MPGSGDEPLTMPRECGNALAWMGCLVGNIGRGGVPDKQPMCAASYADACHCRWSPTFDPKVKAEIVPAHHQKPITKPITKRIKLRTRRGAMPMDRGDGYRSPSLRNGTPCDDSHNS